MRSDVLATDLAAERSRAIRLLLRSPMLNSEDQPDGFRDVVRHHDWLVAWFDDTCGWQLTIDPGAGFARLAKRSRGAKVDVSRPLRRSRGGHQAFDRRRYQLLCLVAAQLVQHPVTTVGLLARAICAEAGLDTSRHRERVALVDVLRTLIEWQALRASGGTVDDFVETEEANALLQADTMRLHRLLVTTVAPSSLADDVSPVAAAVYLGAEPRYGRGREADAHQAGTDDEQRLRRIRHMIGRRLVDDPVVYFEDLDEEERGYLDNPAGRQWLRSRVAEAGFELEERSDGLLAVDPDALATDLQFPGPHGNAHQLALLLVDDLLTRVDGGHRDPVELTPAQLEQAVDAVFERFPNWARSHRDRDGRQALTTEATELLEAFGLARRTPDGGIAGRAAIARYSVGAPVRTGTRTLFDDPPAGAATGEEPS
ncbi:MAG: TIGR02678 family protein [Ilumatobacteraceae bacterium]|nr:TIGR02678 family protein [Ilumatobacteraceae bacterium]